MMRRVSGISLAATFWVASLLLAACNFNPGTPVASLMTATASMTATIPPATLPPSNTPLPINQITPAGSPTPVTPSATPTITQTPGPFEHVIQPGEGLIGIVLAYGHYDLGVLEVVVTMNPNVPNPDRLPPPGSVILIPRPTPSPTPPGGDLTATVLAQYPTTPTPELVTGIHIVEEGQTVIGLARSYNTTIALLARLNPQLYWYGCDFTIASGGPNCSPSLSIGEEIVVPLPTPTPSATPTPSGSETPTPTSTPGPVRLLWPASGSLVTGGPLVLEWVSAGVLQPDEVYQVTVSDSTTGTVYTDFTRENALALPLDLVPVDGAVHPVTWMVRVVRVGADHVAIPAGAPGEERLFQWAAR